jgi:hypothetical protein
MDPIQIALLVSTLVPQLLMTYVNRSMAKGDANTGKMAELEKRVAVLESMTGSTKDVLQELKTSIAKVNDKLDRIAEKQ